VTLHPAELRLGTQQTRRAPPPHVAVTPPRHLRGPLPNRRGQGRGEISSGPPITPPRAGQEARRGYTPVCTPFEGEAVCRALYRGPRGHAGDSWPRTTGVPSRGLLILPPRTGCTPGGLGSYPRPPPRFKSHLHY
jgi:hypothetical protein